jgi:hypothetical protein
MSLPPPAPIPGWYPDPWQQAGERWWDGTQWTGHLRGVAGQQRLAAEHSSARWLRRLLPLQPVATSFSLVLGAYSLRRIVEDFDINDPNSLDLPAVTSVSYPLSTLILLITIFEIIWLLRACEVAQSMGLPLRRSPGWAAAGWIIPIVSLWWPYQGVRDLFPEGERPRRRLGWWWASYIAASVLALGAFVGAWLPVGVAVALLVPPMVAAVAAAVLLWHLVGDAQAAHQRLVDARR